MILPNVLGAFKIWILRKFQVFIFLPIAAHGEHYSSIGKTISNFLSLGWRVSLAGANIETPLANSGLHFAPNFRVADKAGVESTRRSSPVLGRWRGSKGTDAGR